MARLALLLRTLRYQKPRQLWGRLKREFRNRCRKFIRPGLPGGKSVMPRKLYLWKGEGWGDAFPEGGRFRLLNLDRVYPSGVEWGDSHHGPLWHYTLNAFDWAVFPLEKSLEALAYMDAFLKDLPNNPVGMDPWPTSRRIQNWIRVLNREEVPLRDRNRLAGALDAQARVVSRNLETHLLGNHLLENGLALMWAGYWLNNRRFLARSLRVLSAQLKKQILRDGGHEERSPMYHCRLLEGLISSLYMVRNNPEIYRKSTFESVLAPAVEAMMGWTRAISFSDGSLPQVNDSAPGGAPSPAALEIRVHELGVPVRTPGLGESGYRRLVNHGLELLADVGPMGPDHNPGHGHCDALSFILHVNGHPLLVDTGTSSYDEPEVRFAERSTRAHNTVMVDGREQSEIWGKFRVGRRARIRDLSTGENYVEATHTGYDIMGIRHCRRLELYPNELRILDRVQGSPSRPCEANFHFHPRVPVNVTPESASWPGGRMTWGEGIGTAVECPVSAGFNKRVPATVVRVLVKP